MKGRGLRYWAKTEEELKQEYWTEDRRPFHNHLKSALPHQTAMAQGILALKKVRDFAPHGAVFKWGSGAAETDGIIHVDAPATVFAQRGFMSRSLRSIVLRHGMADTVGGAGARQPR